jgi:Zn-dependent protease with chaperone function
MARLCEARRMTTPPEDEPAAARVWVRLPDLSSRAYEHPADRSALVALRRLSGFDVVLRRLFGLIGERRLRLLYLASAVRVSEAQFGGIDRLYSDAVRTLDMPSKPELFVVQRPVPQAMTLGLDEPFIVVSTGLLDLVDDDELRFVLGHELGHALSGHAVYQTMLLALLRLSAGIGWLPIGYLGLRALIAALREWSRKAELSGDRAGLLAGQDVDAALRTHMKLAGGARLEDMDAAAFLAQGREYDAAGDLRDGVLKLLNLEQQTHPFAVTRAVELRRWIDSGEYDQVLAGDYPRRADDPATSVTDEVRAAARSYRESFDASADPLVGLLRDLGGGVAGVRDRVSGWMRRPATADTTAAGAAANGDPGQPPPDAPPDAP